MQFITQQIHQKDEPEFKKDLDSVMATFPYVSTADKYYYLYLRRGNIHKNPDDKKLQEVAIVYTDSMLDLITNAGLKKPMKKEYLKALQDKGDIMIRQKRYAEATQLISECRFENKRDGDIEGMADNINTIAYITYYQRKFKEAIVYFKEALSYFQVTGPLHVRYYKVQRVLDDIAVMYRAAGNPDSALFYHMTAAKYLDENYKMLLPKDSLFRYLALLNVYDNIAYTYLEKSEFDKSMFYCQKAIDISRTNLENIYTKTEQADLYQTLASGLFGKGDVEKAAAMNALAAESYNDLGPYSQLSLLELQAKIDSARGDVKNRMKHLSLYMQMNDSISNNSIQAFKKDPVVVYEAIVRKNELELKNKSIRLQTIRSGAAIIVGTLFALLAITLFLNLKKIRQMVKKLRKTMLEVQLQQKQKEEEQLRFQEVRLQANYQDAIAKQRQEISNDLHDSLSGSLVALRYLIDDIKGQQQDDNIKKTLHDIGAEVSSIYTATREYMHSLNAGETTIQHDLPAQLKDLAAKYSGTTSFSISLDADDEAITEKLAFYQQDQLFFIIKEAVTNTMKYANASGISISIGFEGNNCIFSIIDDGTGFDIKKKGTGLGLDSMRSRMQDLDGELQIESGEKGTTIKGRFPISDKKVINEEKSIDYLIN